MIEVFAAYTGRHKKECLILPWEKERFYEEGGVDLVLKI